MESFFISYLRIYFRLHEEEFEAEKKMRVYWEVCDDLIRIRLNFMEIDTKVKKDA